MKLEQSEKHMMFNMTQIPDIFFSEYCIFCLLEYAQFFMGLIDIAKYLNMKSTNLIIKSIFIIYQYF